MKTRSSSGVNSKIDLEFDADSLRIRDLAEDEDYQEFEKRKSTVYDQLKRTSAPADNSQQTETDFTDTTAPTSEHTGDEVGKIRAETDSTALRSFINNLK
jgi:hypothetical protein